MTTVYVESNWILDVSLKQERYKYSMEILRFAEENKISLIIPMVSIAESCHVIIDRKIKTEAIVENCKKKLHTIERSDIKEHRTLARPLRESILKMKELYEREKKQLDETVKNILAIAQILPINSRNFCESISIQTNLGLDPFDSLIYSLVREHAATCKEDKIFLNYDEDFKATSQLKKDMRKASIKFFIDGKKCIDYLHNKSDKKN